MLDGGNITAEQAANLIGQETTEKEEESRGLQPSSQDLPRLHPQEALTSPQHYCV